ncbi:MAG: efflux RND transporter periplasmic adaptor subunit [Alphaproteobacteria bacterium]|jgi:multidrug efflux system membrane fusion protein|nr:efflux RND transporter periplasmic adaptor subunit [Alphaproteobacteria bacterium]
MKRSWIIAGLVALAAGGWILSGQIDLGHGANGSTATGTPNATVSEPEGPGTRPRVRIMVSTAEPVTNELILQGRTAANRRVELRAETHGSVADVLVDRGARVAAGDTLVRLSVDEREARLAGARALVAQREIEATVAEELFRRGHRANTQLAAARAALDAARAALRVAEVEMENLVVTAPFDGVVAERMVEIGDYVDIGDPMVRLLDLDPLHVVAQVSERHLGMIAEGTPGAARLLDGQMLEGTVTFVAPEASSATRTFAIELEAPNPEGRFIDGVTAELTLPYADIRAHRLAPSVLTLSDAGVIGVKAVDADDRVVFHPVEIVDGNREAVWITGLPDRLRLITVGQDYVRAGDRVEPVLTAQIAEGEEPR